MADISKIELNGVIYDIKDETARRSNTETEALKIRVDNIEGDISNIEDDITSLDNKIDTEVSNINSELDNIDNKADSAVATSNSAKNDVGRANERVTSLEFRTNLVESDISALNDTVEKQEREITHLTEYSETVNDKAETNRQALTVLEERMDEFSSLPDGSTTGDAELADIRVGYNGITYSTAGNAVRAQSKLSADALVKDNSIDLLSLFARRDNRTVNGVTYTWDGNVCTLNGTATANGASNLFTGTDGIPPFIEKGKKYLLKINIGDTEYPRRAVPSIVLLAPTNVYVYANDNCFFEVPNDCTGMTIRIYQYQGAVFNNFQISFSIYEESAYPNETLYKMANDSDNVYEQYVKYNYYTGYWRANGTLTNGGYHTDFLRVRPNTDYYTVDALETIEDISSIAAAFDANKNFIGTILKESLTEVNYRKPDATGNYDTYCSIYKFTTPDNCYYISLNARQVYRRGVSSKPVYTVWLTDNLIIKKGNASYEKKKDKKLCVIGTSMVMIDRLGRSGNFTPPYDESPASQYICGFQEYLVPWYDSVESYGYSNTGFVANPDPNVGSIYKYVVTNRLNLSGYDDFMICCSSIGVDSSNIGTLNGPHDLGDMYTYMGSIRQIIEYIYSQNPNATIYLLTRYNRPAFSSESYYDNQKMVNDATREIGELLSLPIIDSAKDSGFNSYNADKWCYDSNGHYNHYGNKEFGLFVRNNIVGI